MSPLARGLGRFARWLAVECPDGIPDDDDTCEALADRYLADLVRAEAAARELYHHERSMARLAALAANPPVFENEPET